MKKTPPVGKKFSFEAKLEVWAEGMDYCAVSVPAKITERLGTKSAVLVMAKVNNSEPFKVSLFPVGGGKHCIRIKAKVRRETKTKAGDRVRIRIVTIDRSSNTYPPDLLSALKSKNVVEEFKAIPPGEQNFILRRVDEAAKPETRKKRINEAVTAAIRRIKKLI